MIHRTTAPFVPAALTLAALTLAAPLALAQTKVTAEPWGNVDSQPVTLYTLSDSDLAVRITNFGAHIVSIQAPDRSGKKADVILGFNNLAGFVADKSTYMGSVVGRYGNRIAGGTFSLDGHTYHIPTNDHGFNSLHGGTAGFDRKVWTARQLPNGVELALLSPDGDQGFPGALTVHVRYILSGHSLEIHYSATTTEPTVLNLTNHTYFNLSGEGNGTILHDILTIPASRYTPANAKLIPTGQLAPVAGTPLDFTKPTEIGKRIDDDNEQLKLAGGYDHNWVLNASGPGLHEAAKVLDPASGRTLTVTTTQPGVQFYTANFLDGSLTGASGKPYPKHAGFCLETQHFPDSPNHPNFPSTELKPGQTFQSETVFTFGVQR